MKKFLLSAALLVVFGAYAFSVRRRDPPAIGIVPEAPHEPLSPLAATSSAATSSLAAVPAKAKPRAGKKSQPTESKPTLAPTPPDVTPAPAVQPPPEPTLTTNPEPTPAPTPAVPALVPAARYKDGEFTGTVADAFFGNLQVAAVVSDGKLSDMKFLQFPNDRET